MKQKKKSILFIIWSFTYGGGAEKILANLVNNLDPEKYEIDILEYQHGGKFTEALNDGIRLLPPIINAEIDGPLKRLLVYKTSIYCPYLIRKLYNNKEYDLEIAFNHLLPTFLLSYNKKSLMISWVHGTIYDVLKEETLKKKQLRSFKKSDAIVSISNLAHESIIDVFPVVSRKVLKIENGYNFNKIYEMSLEEPKIDFKKPTICFVGRLDDNKQPELLVYVLDGLVKAGHDTNLVYIGEGEKSEEIISIANDLGISSNIILTGYCKNPYPLIKNSMCLIMMSKSEGFPTVFVESLALGVPFISTLVGGAEELSLNGQCGLIIDSVDSCIDAVIELLVDEKKYKDMKDMAKIHASRYTIERQVEAFENLVDLISLNHGLE